MYDKRETVSSTLRAVGLESMTGEGSQQLVAQTIGILPSILPT